MAPIPEKPTRSSSRELRVVLISWYPLFFSVFSVLVSRTLPTKNETVRKRAPSWGTHRRRRSLAFAPGSVLRVRLQGPLRGVVAKARAGTGRGEKKKEDTTTGIDSKKRWQLQNGLLQPKTVVSSFGCEFKGPGRPCCAVWCWFHGL